MLLALPLSFCSLQSLGAETAAGWLYLIMRGTMYVIKVSVVLNPVDLTLSYNRVNRPMRAVQ